MSLPVYLPYNIVSIYGIGSLTGVSGIEINDPLRFGVIDDVSQYGITWAQVGNSVLFNEKDIVCRLVYANSPHTIIAEENLILKEYPAP